MYQVQLKPNFLLKYGTTFIVWLVSHGNLARLKIAVEDDDRKFSLIFFNTWFTDFFQNIKVGGGKKIKIKIIKKIFFI